MDQYAKSFTKPSIRIGTITVLLAMLGSFFPNIYLYLAHGVWPDASHMFSAWGSVAMAFGAFYLVEPISYFPVFGPTGTYIGILSGNISQIRLPAASTAQDVLGVEPSSHKGEVVGILAICGSVVTNILFLTVAVVAGSTLLAFLPESVTPPWQTTFCPLCLVPASPPWLLKSSRSPCTRCPWPSSCACLVFRPGSPSFAASSAPFSSPTSSTRRN